VHYCGGGVLCCAGLFERRLLLLILFGHWQLYAFTRTVRLSGTVLACSSLLPVHCFCAFPVLVSCLWAAFDYCCFARLLPPLLVRTPLLRDACRHMSELARQSAAHITCCHTCIPFVSDNAGLGAMHAWSCGLYHVEALRNP
jgi:hypothetical protein